VAFLSRRYVDTGLARAGLVKVRGATLGFGPFTFFLHRVLPEPFATDLHHRLQRRADRGVPILRATGLAYHVLAAKRDAP
jgi:hypothetical protein